MLDDRVHVPATTPRSCTKHFAGSCLRDRIELSPAGLQQLLEGLKLGVVDRLGVASWRNVWRSEISGRAALESLSYSERGKLGRHMEAEPSSTENACVSRAVIEEGLQG